MTDEQRLHMITEQLILVRDNLFRGMSKSMQKLQARSINEMLALDSFTESSPNEWVGLTGRERKEIERQSVYVEGAIHMTEAKLREKNGGKA
jgi:hypothetical protein